MPPKCSALRVRLSPSFASHSDVHSFYLIAVGTARQIMYPLIKINVTFRSSHTLSHNRAATLRRPLAASIGASVWQGNNDATAALIWLANVHNVVALEIYCSLIRLLHALRVVFTGGGNQRRRRRRCRLLYCPRTFIVLTPMPQDSGCESKSYVNFWITVSSNRITVNIESKSSCN